jgi:beta-galactosidase
MFFQWRAARAGAEKFHGAMVPHGAPEQSRVFREVAQLGAELRTLDAVLDARVPAGVAILFDWESWWGLELDSRPSTSVHLLEQVAAYYRPLYASNVTVDFVLPDVDLSRYRLVLAPNLYMVGEGTAANLERFVSDGGTLVMSFFSGIVDRHDHILLGGYPVPFRRLLGLRVEEFDPYAPGQTNAIAVAEGGQYTCDLWSDVITLEGAVALATFERDFYAGRPAVTVHQFGSGRSCYVGTRPEPAFMEWLLERARREAGVEAVAQTGPGVEAARRVRGQETFLFLLNHNARPVDVKMSGPARDLLTGSQHEGTIRLDAYGVAVLQEQPHAQPTAQPPRRRAR